MFGGQNGIGGLMIGAIDAQLRFAERSIDITAVMGRVRIGVGMGFEVAASDTHARNGDIAT